MTPTELALARGRDIITRAEDERRQSARRRLAGYSALLDDLLADIVALPPAQAVASEVES